MAEKRKAAPRYNTPIGVAGWAHLNEADEYNGKRQFKVDLILSSEDAAKITDTEAFHAAEKEAEAMMTAAMEKAAAKLGKGKKPKEQDKLEAFQPQIDKDTSEETGDVVFKFKANESWTNDKGEVKFVTIPFFTAAGIELKGKQRPNVFAGSRLRVSYSLVPYHNAGANNYGVSLRLQAIKIIALSAGNGAGKFGFGEAEEGYTGPTEAVDDGSAPLSEAEYGSADATDF